MNDETKQCRHPSCTNPARKGDETCDLFAQKFCSPQCEVTYEDLKWDARDAAMDHY